MEKEQFTKSLKKLKNIHTIGIVALLVGMAVSMNAPISELWQESGSPYWLKSVLIIIAMVSIPLIYNQYDKNVVKGKESRTEDEQMENTLKWSYIRMAIWLINPLLCLTAYHFDTDSLTSDAFTSIFYLYCVGFCFYAFVGRPGGWKTE